MALELTYKATTTIPVELAGFTPEAAREKSLAEIEQWPILHGNQQVPLGELFHVSGDAGDGRWDFHGDLSGVHWIGAKMEKGEIHLHGPAGRHAGSEMTGGEIHVEGDAGDWLGASMHGGKIHVRGSAGDNVGAAYRGHRRGMTGGMILIEGSAGSEVGHSMRGGWISLGGSTGDMVGYNMIAGTILVFGGCGRRPGAGMRRGTIGLLGGEIPDLLPTFRHNSRYRPLFLQVMLRELRQHAFDFDQSLLQTDFEIFSGDFLALGKGEILLPASEAAAYAQ